MKLKRIISSMLAAVLLLGTLQVLPAGAAENARYAEFENPSIDYKSRPLWFWNVFGDSATMDKQRLIDTVNGSLESGYSGFGILPYGQGGYLGDDYFDMYRTVLEACKKNGMKLNLYDENGFPSGPAGGLFQQTYPEDTSKALYKTEKEVTGPVKGKMAVDLGTENEPLMGAVAMNVDTKEIIELTAVSEEMQQTSFTTTASSYFTLLPGYTADMATDGNPATRWNAGDRSGNDEWLQLEFEQPVTFDSAVISEAYDRTTSYHIQYWDGSGWVNASEGNTIGASKTDSFAPVTSNKVRLYIDTIVDPDVNSVTIWEFDLQKDGQSVLRTGGDCVNYDLGEGTWKVMAFNLRRDGNSFCDYLDAEDVRKFISITHDAYYDQFAEYFGDVIDMTFYDEPALWRSNTWTEKYNEKFEEEYGFDPVKYYPALWYDIGEDTAFARSTLFDFRAELFADSWTKTLADWCDEHNIDLTGHVGEEELINPTNTVGDLMKAFRSQDIPGIDEVIFYGRISRALKVVSSSANNWDKQKVMVEIHGADDNLDIPTLYRDVMDHFAKGINLMVPHAVWYTPYGAGFMNPELSYRDPYWGPALPDYNDFIGRSASILQQEGQHVADIGVLYPIDSLHNGFVFDGGYDPYKGGVTPQAEWNYMDLGEMLSLDIRRDFTYLHPDIIDERCSVEGDTFKLNNEVNYEQYKVILLPGCDTISVSNLEKIKEFYDGGGLVIGTRQLPYQSSEQGQSARVVELIKEMFGVDPRSSTGPIYTSSSQYEVQWMGDTIGLEPWKAGDDDLGTRWESNGSTNEWLEVNFAQPQQIAKAVISEYAKAVTS
ncbi:MAG: glycosyl hydrolase, partial [Massilioclostridium sp.]|nr:glycosyl hydrolase [Massilioclostridium sp.]